ncbi:HNH endonuclease [Haloechinothrix halophila]|uniref:HNH endonuclease n=1 Tax=Haloechinothrix halophila TaxID=1069073 RepID=UPI0004077EDA|nr:HNH endonuclease [Haloechinothrix halophila]
MSSADALLPEPGPHGWWQAADTELAEALRTAEEVRNRAEAAQAAVLAEIQSRGVFATYGYPSLATLQRDLLRISTTEAKKRATRAQRLHPTREGTSEKPAAAPMAAQAAAEGVLNPGHVDAISETMAAMPADIDDTDRASYEKTLIDLARQAQPAVVRRAGRHLLALVDPDGREPTDDEELAEPERELLWSWTRHNRLKLRGTLDSESGQLLETLLSALAKPRPTVEGMPDQRTTGQRQGDAFAELLDYTQRATERPTEAGETPVITVSMTLDQLLRREPLMDEDGAVQQMLGDTPTLNWECPVTAEQARRLACDARLVPAVLGSTGEILDLGREVRTATRAQRRALAARDGGCIMCSRTVRWCQVHHINWWEHGGTTTLDNLCLLCSACHRLVHHAGWEVRMATDGTPECLPPAWLDPARQPRRFTAPHTEPLGT